MRDLRKVVITVLLTKAEQETLLSFDEANADAQLYTYNADLIKRLDRLTRTEPDVFRQEGDDGYGGKTYSFPKDRLDIRFCV